MLQSSTYLKIQESVIETVKDIEIAWPGDDAVRLANAIYHTYKTDEYKDPNIEVPMTAVCKMFQIEDNPKSAEYISKLLDEILDEPVAVINKELDRKLIKWKTYTLFTLLEPVEMSGGLIKLKINLDYLRITKEFVVNPYLEF